ncbi:MAG: hypothetical protein WAW73_20330 [Rhodoferax sp.]
MKRTAWPRKSSTTVARTVESDAVQPLALVEYAHTAIKSIVKCSAVMARIGDFSPRVFPKEPKPWRSESYRRLVASLECYHCRIHGHSQAAHPNTGKAKGKKACDSLIFPMCTVGGNDCHGRFDQYRLVSRADMPAYEEAAARWTVATLQARGMFPKTNQPPALM